LSFAVLNTISMEYIRLSLTRGVSLGERSYNQQIVMQAD